MWLTIRKTYDDGLLEIFRRYWRAYGGARALVLSPYFHGAVLLTVLLYPYWLRQPWWDVALSVIPSLLGFTLAGFVLAGFTIWLGLSNPRLRERIFKPGVNGTASVYVQVAATFSHFAVTQILALLLAIIAKALNVVLAMPALAQGPIEALAPWGRGLGFLVFAYAVMTAWAAVMGAFRVATWQDMLYGKETTDLGDHPPQI